jgi:hypothetical protein
MMLGIKSFGPMRLSRTFVNASKSVYGMKKIVGDTLYWLFIGFSASWRPSILALPMALVGVKRQFIPELGYFLDLECVLFPSLRVRHCP